MRVILILGDFEHIRDKLNFHAKEPAEKTVGICLKNCSRFSPFYDTDFRNLIVPKKFKTVPLSYPNMQCSVIYKLGH